MFAVVHNNEVNNETHCLFVLSVYKSVAVRSQIYNVPNDQNFGICVYIYCVCSNCNI